MDKGWIKLHRKLKKHWVWESPLHLKIWLDFLLRANFTDNKIAIDSRLEHIKIGQFITSLKKLAIEYHCTMGKIRNFLKLLEKDSMIELKTTNKFTRITICNYTSYQDEQQTERNQNEIRMKSEWNQNETVKKDKKEKNVKEDYTLELLDRLTSPLQVPCNKETETESQTESKSQSKSEHSNKIDFNTFWDLYDKKVGDKTKLQKKWDKLTLEIQTKALEHITEYKTAQQDKQYRKNPDTYLNNKSWNDEIISKDQTQTIRVVTA